ncbi:hypothetical protein GH714_020242 [Hevea brasiliensis]|uniref:Transcriptional regulator n=1 Tax=Hevea brasiliensis TaxID=3981 RepID=A0A6A6N8T2_HEVBR|nr:hypothetical protein GH714_020242 [Hevea brasiliensis]
MAPFDKSMVLIVKVNQNTGFEGLIYNNLIKWDSVDDLDKGFELLKEAPLSLGGPLIKGGKPFVALTRRLIKDQYPEVASGIYFLDQKATLHEIEELKSGNQSIADYWFFFGYASWGWDQLYDEIAAGAWELILMVKQPSIEVIEKRALFVKSLPVIEINTNFIKVLNF